MKRAVSLVVVVLALGCSLAAQQASKPAPRLANGKPDLSGVWARPYVPDMTRNGRNQKGADLPFTPAGLEAWKSYDAANGDYTGSCLPFGMTRSFNSPYPMQIVQNDAVVALLFEQNTWFHAVPTDDVSVTGAPPGVNCPPAAATAGTGLETSGNFLSSSVRV